MSDNSNTQSVNVTHIVVRLADGREVRIERPQRGPQDGPSKRYNRNTSGRASRRQMNGQASIRKVGGYSDTIKAIYAGSDKEAEGVISTNWHNMCVVVNDRTRNYTRNPTAQQWEGDLGGRGA